MKPFSDSLGCVNLAEGHGLGRQMAELALADRSASQHDMAAPRTAPLSPAIEMRTAVTFQAVADANAGWRL